MSISLREFGTLSVSGEPNGLDHQLVSSTSFASLKAWALRVREKDEREVFRLISRYNTECIQVLNYVGLVALPDAEQLEILPKTSEDNESIEDGRRVLLRMLSVVHKLPFDQSGFASLQTLSRPWIDVLINHVLRQIAQLTRSGLKNKYSRVQNELSVLKGQLRVSQQLRQRPGRAQYFHVAYDEYSLNRAENRLLKTAISKLSGWAKSADSQRLCRELLFVMDNVPTSKNIKHDLQAWSFSRDMIRYQPLLPWIKLILENQTPLFSRGRAEGISLLFPMERLFEEYVTTCLEQQMHAAYSLKSQASSEYLVSHKGDSWFNLRPDLLVLKGTERVAIMDTKWKRLDSELSGTDKKYGLSQSDFYQMFAYGEKYLGGTGLLVLIYPCTERFQQPLAAFSFGDSTLLAMPFDLEKGVLVEGEHSFEFLQQSASDHIYEQCVIR
jgi:5-methylcytosine-specific restriction enzyme subunit McrC